MKMQSLSQQTESARVIAAVLKKFAALYPVSPKTLLSAERFRLADGIRPLAWAACADLGVPTRLIAEAFKRAPGTIIDRIREHQELRKRDPLIALHHEQILDGIAPLLNRSPGSIAYRKTPKRTTA